MCVCVYNMRAECFPLAQQGPGSKMLITLVTIIGKQYSIINETKKLVWFERGLLIYSRFHCQGK